jgi:CRP-like cAMP-binding protein
LDIVGDAVTVSFLGELPAATLIELLDRAHIQRLFAGEMANELQQLTGIVVSGLVRVFSLEPPDRRITFRNASRGEAVGLPAMVGLTNTIGIQAVTRSAILRFDLRVVAKLLATERTFATAVAREAVRRLADTHRAMTVRVHGTARQQVARHMLDLAANSGVGDPVRIAVTHQAIGESLELRRETVTKLLDDLSHSGVVRLSRGAVSIIDPTTLRAMAYGG